MSKPTKQQAAEAYWSSAAAERSLTCPVWTTLNVLGGKWKLLILPACSMSPGAMASCAG